MDEQHRFEIVSKYKPTGDQPTAIKKLTDGILNSDKFQVLLGATGTGKTFTMANIIQNVQKPTLVLVHNKTLAGQLYSEFKELFPHNRVEYFVSNFDFYQPEAYIFVRVEGEDEDISIKPGKTRGALHGDKVRVVMTRSHGHHPEGEIVSIIERSTKPFIGILHIVGRQAWVLMSSRTMPYDISVPVPPLEGVRSGMKVAAVVDSWPRGEAGPLGHVVDILGNPGENDTEMHAILAEYGLPYRFTKEVEDAADKISDVITDKERAGRRDFRKVLTFTIDPADAKDYDDAPINPKQ